MKVLVADKMEDAGREGLAGLGCEVVFEPALTTEGLPDALAKVDPQILIVRSTKVPANVLEAGASLKGVIRAGAGYDNIDGAAAAGRGVAVCNCPGMNAVAVAEVAMGHLINADRRIPAQTTELRAGKWRKKEFAKAKGLKGRRLGIVGVGAIGKAVVDRARAFELDVVAWSRGMDAARASELGVSSGGSSRDELLKMIGDCDAVSVHVAATDDTKGMCDAEFFGAMKDGAIFVNTARGTVVDEAALASAIEGKGLRVGLDVYQNQPATPEADWSNELAAHVASCTHHCGASTEQAQEAVAHEVVRIVRVFRDTGNFENKVN